MCATDRVRRSLEERSAIIANQSKRLAWWKLRGRGDKFIHDEIGFGESLTGMVSKKSCNAAMIHQRGSADPSKTISGRVGSSSGLPAFINHFVFPYAFDSRRKAVKLRQDFLGGREGGEKIVEFSSFQEISYNLT